MQAQDRSLGIVFGVAIRMVVPLFQRPYVWNQDDNWKPLWGAVVEATDRRLSGKEPRRRFLGSIVLGDLKMPTGEVTARQIIDGQQRLTTLQVLLAALRDLSIERGEADYGAVFGGLIRNLVASKKDPNSVYKVWPTNQDREAFRAVMEAKSRAAVDEVVKGKSPKLKHLREHLIPQAYCYFYDHAERLLKRHEASREDVLEALHHALQDDLILVVVDLDKEDDPQLIFETLNALGTPLLPADLVKNYLFHQAELEEAPIDELYNEHWKALDQDQVFWRQEVRQGRLKRPRIDLFLAHYLALKSRSVVNVGHLFGTFREIAESAQLPAADQMRTVREYADVYRRFHEFPELSREARFFSRLDALDTSMVYPVLLEVLRDTEDLAQSRRCLDMLESYLVRRAICGLTYKSYNRIFVDLIKAMAERGFTAGTLEQFLLTREGESASWPTDAEVLTAFETYPAYRKIKRSRVLMILEAIELHIRQGRLTENVTIHDKLTIEHVMPQKWQSNWPFPSGVNGEHEARRNQLVHTFGNLTLVTDSLNPTLSNGAWRDKRPALLKYSILALNHAFQDQDEWNEEAIIQRGRELGKVALTLWSRPAEG